MALRSILRIHVARLLELEPAARGLSPEGIHQMRSAARKMRGSIRVLGPLLDQVWAKNLSDDVRWLSRQLGEVRDLDVLLDALGKREAEAPGSVPELIRGAIHERREAARAALLASLDAPRYELLRARLVEAARHPWLKAAGDRAAGAALLRRLLRRSRALRRLARSLNAQSPEERFHEVRKRGKDLRFAAQAMAPWLGKKRGAHAERLAARIAKGTDLLGVFQDRVIGVQIVSEVGAARGVDAGQVGPAVASWVADQAAQRGEAVARFLADRKRWVRRSEIEWMS